MNNLRNKSFALSALAVAVNAAMALSVISPTLAMAEDDDEVAALTRPTNSVELGARNLSDVNAKFGEYNGLTGADGNKTTPIGNFDVKGGDSYGQDTGTTRWSASGSGLGTKSFDTGLKYEDQGNWRSSINFDQLQHNFGTIQTPYQGEVGKNAFTLPSSFGTISTVANGTNPIGTNNMTAAQKASFQDVDVYTKRKNTTFSAGRTLDSRWDLEFDYNHLDQSGGKLMGVSSSGDYSLGATSANSPAWKNQATMWIVNPTNYKTDTFNVAANWKGDKQFATFSIYTSHFSDGYQNVTFNNPIISSALNSTTTAGFNTYGYQVNTMSTAPSNDFFQYNFSGGTDLSQTAKLVVNYSKGHTTQNDSFLKDLLQADANAMPNASLQGSVDTTHLGAKLTNQYSRDLMVTASYRMNERDNHSSSAMYKILDVGGANNYTINTPLSNRKTNAEVAADYKTAPGQNLRVALEQEKIHRWCNNVAGGTSTIGPTGQTQTYTSPAGANCAVVPESTENKIGFNYRVAATERVTVNAGVQHANRNSEYDPAAITPLGNTSSVKIGSTSYYNRIGMVNADDFPGYHSFYSASRMQNLIKLGSNVEVTEQLNVTATAKYGKDTYPDSTLGVQHGKTASLNLDASYQYTEAGAFSLYATEQTRNRDLLSGAASTVSSTTGTGVYNSTTVAGLVAPSNTYANSMKDTDKTVGFNVRHKGFVTSKLDVMADYSVTVGRTIYNTQLNYTPTSTTICTASNVLSCGDTPEIYSRFSALKLKGDYHLERNSTVSLVYLRQRLLSNDYMYNGLQMGYTASALMPTNQQAPNYKAYVVGLSLVHKF